MSQEKVDLNISLREIDSILCANCKRKLRKLIREKLPDQLIEKAISGQK
jgi:hypothetical protein